MNLQALLDEREIIRGLGFFARILDEKRWEDLTDVFAEDVRFDYGTGAEQKGIDALRATMTRYLDRCGATQHLIGSILVDVTDNAASSRAYVQARHQATDGGGGKIYDTNGEYRDRWERRDSGWRIVHREAIWATASGEATIIGA